MCDRCGCGDTKIVSVEAHESLLAANDEEARHNRAHLVEDGILAINLMGSPGSGKTALLEATARVLAPARRGTLAAVSGDLATDLDGRRLRAAGIAAWSIQTGSACHLDAQMIHAALHDLPDETELFFIENVGNLVCPAVYDLGQAANVVVLSVTEGPDKPLKYPVMFKNADLVVLNKIDLLPVLPEIDVREIRRALGEVMPEPRMIELSARTGHGLAQWVGWLEMRRRDLHRPERRVS